MARAEMPPGHSYTPEAAARDVEAVVPRVMGDHKATYVANALRRLAALDAEQARNDGVTNFCPSCERLAREVERLRAALERIVREQPVGRALGWEDVALDYRVIAREALEPPVEGVPGLEGSDG